MRRLTVAPAVLFTLCLICFGSNRGHKSPEHKGKPSSSNARSLGECDQFVMRNTQIWPQLRWRYRSPENGIRKRLGACLGSHGKPNPEFSVSF
jgi:hypothetical protein